MPKLYEYLGIVIYFWSNEHLPIHVHGKKGGQESKVELHFLDGKLEEVRFVPTKRELDSKDKRDFEKFVRVYADG